jgi:hypothetical protein
MKSDKAFEAAKEQLRREMPKAAFERYVRDLHLLDSDDGTFVIGAPTIMARDWVSGRLSSQMQRMLTGIMNRSVDVQFTVNSAESDANPETEAGESTNEDHLEMQLVHHSIRELLVRPNQVVVVPAYFLRWIPYLGATNAWIVVAFRQLMYLKNGGGSGRERTFTVSFKEITRWAGVSRKTLSRALNDSRLGCFVRQIDNPGKDQVGQINRYQLQAGIPLTPGDTQRLHEWLLAAGIQTDPIGALEWAIEVPPHEILEYPPNPPTAEYVAYTQKNFSVQDVVLGLVDRVDQAVFQKIISLCDQLSNRLQPSSDQLHIPHYFIRYWLPVLKAGAGWLVTLLRDRCYADAFTGEIRDTTMITGGNAQLASLLGVSTRTMRNWLGGRTTIARHLAKFIKVLERGHLKEGNAVLFFQTEQLDPLRSKHLAEFEAAVALVHSHLYGDEDVVALINAELEKMSHEGGNFVSREWKKSPTRAEKMSHGSGKNVPRSRKSVSRERKKCPTGAEILSPLKTLNRISLNSLLILIQQTSGNIEIDDNQQPQPEVDNVTIGSEIGGGVGNEWDLGELLSHHHQIRPQDRQTLLSKQASSQAFVSWLLYAHSPAGQGIKRPGQFVASRLLKAPHDGAGEPYDQAARLSPAQLSERLNTALRDPLKHLTDPVIPDRIEKHQELIHAIFGPLTENT